MRRQSCDLKRNGRCLAPIRIAEASRENPQKYFSIYARKTYNGSERFDFDFFDTHRPVHSVSLRGIGNTDAVLQIVTGQQLAEKVQRTLQNEIKAAESTTGIPASVYADAITPDDVVLVHDDLLATGGTVGAVNRLVRQFNPKAVYDNFIIELPALKGRQHIPDGTPVTALLALDGD